MSRKSIQTIYPKVKVSAEAHALYERRQPKNDDPENPVVPPEIWERHGVVGKYFRPIKKQTTVRLDADVLEWLKSKGDGHITRVNTILRAAMEADIRSERSQA